MPGKLNLKHLISGLAVVVFVLLSPTAYTQTNSDIDGLQKKRSSIELTITEMNKQYEQVLNKIKALKNKNGLNLLEEAELMRLLAIAMNLSNHLDEKYRELEEIDSKLKNTGVNNPEPKESLIRLRFAKDNIVEGPAELKERAMILKDKEERLNSQIKKLEEIEKRMKLREEAQAFIKEQSLFDEDSSISIVKKNIKGVAEESTSIANNTNTKPDTKNGMESTYNDTMTLSGDTSGSPSNPPSSIRVKIEVTYEKSGIINQATSESGKSLILNIDPNNTNPEELSRQIEELKKIYNELSKIRSETEKKIIEIEKAFKDKR